MSYVKRTSIYFCIFFIHLHVIHYDIKLNAYILKASYVKLVQYKPQALSSLESAITYTRVKVYNLDIKVTMFH